LIAFFETVGHGLRRNWFWWQSGVFVDSEWSGSHCFARCQHHYSQ